MYAGIDLGSTNIKCAIYDGEMNLLSRRSHPVFYNRQNGFVEFDALSYAESLVSLIRETMADASVRNLKGMAFTGQAETLVLVGKDGLPVRPAISWMDERCKEEAAELAEKFPAEVVSRISGQAGIIPTWPATKILWLQRHEKESIDKTETFMLLKDYIVFYLTGNKIADMSISTFSSYFDIFHKCYWKEMLDTIGITEDRLPALAEPMTDGGNLLEVHKKTLGLTEDCFVNIGTLDHFAGMIGTGNLEPGNITLSTGTVMAMATLCKEVPIGSNLALHYGFQPDTYIMLPVAESGGVSLEWFKRNCMTNISYEKMNEELLKRDRNDLIFLPYLVGTNAPEFDSDASGVFYGLRQDHDVLDMAHAVMEGVAYVLRKNCETMVKEGTVPTSIIATGGGSNSPVWCKLDADITGLPVRIPKEKEAACLGAAMIAAVQGKTFACLKCAAKKCVSFLSEYTPEKNEAQELKYRKFNALYEATLTIARMK